jgi:hypothetical protein
MSNIITIPSWMDSIILNLTGSVYSSIEELKEDCSKLEQSAPELITQINTIISVVLQLDEIGLIKRPQLTAHQIIDETVAFYSEDTSRRSYNSDINNCLYLGPNGTKCAYSRCWKEGVYSPDMEQKTPHELSIHGYEPDSIVQEQYKGHSDEFWFNLQQLHDDTNCWDEKGLTSKGTIFVEKLKSIF